MRTVSGLLALLLGLAALLGGIGLQTIWAPPQTLTAEVAEQPAEAPLTLITGEFAQVDDDAVDYTLTGDGEYTVMLGRERDIRAWIGDAAHNTVTGIETEVPEGQAPRVLVEHTEGEAPVPNPVGSDLWIETHEVSGTLEQRWTLPEEDQTALLVAVDGTEPAPADMTVTWTNRVGTSPWITPLIVLGSALILAGLALLAWALLRGRRDRDRTPGGDDGSAGAEHRDAAPGAGASTGAGSSTHRRTAVRTAAAGVMAAGLLVPSAAVASPAPSDQATPAAAEEDSEEHIPVLVNQQLERILQQVEQGAERADAERDIDLLSRRVGGLAHSMRQLHYRNKGYDDSLVAQAPIAAGPILAAAVSEDPAFPRTLVAVTEGEDNDTPQVLLMQQATARSQYQVKYAVPMTPGSQLAGSTLDQPGTRLLEPGEQDGLVMSPQEAVDGVAAVLTDADHDFAEKMVPSSYAEAIQKYQDELAQTARDAVIRLGRTVQEDRTVAVRMPDGSALVFAHVHANVNSHPKERGGTVIASELAQKVARESSNEITTALFMRFYETMVLHVPAESAEGEAARVSLVGFDDELFRVSYRD